jgi:hypothetical protein
MKRRSSWRLSVVVDAVSGCNEVGTGEGYLEARSSARERTQGYGGGRAERHAVQTPRRQV